MGCRMSEQPKARRPAVDWESVEREYRAGVKTLRQIGDEFGCSHVAVKKRAEREGWTRDLSAKIKEAAEAKVTKAEVTKAVTKEQAVSERVVIDTNAQMLADKVLGQREDIRRARAIVQRLWDIVDAELDSPEEFRALGEMMRSEDEFGQDRLNDMYRAAIGLPQQIKNVKLLADAIKTLIELERKVLRLDTTAADALDKLVDQKAKPMTAAEAYMLVVQAHESA